MPPKEEGGRDPVSSSGTGSLVTVVAVCTYEYVRTNGRTDGRDVACVCVIYIPMRTVLGCCVFSVVKVVMRGGVGWSKVWKE